MNERRFCEACEEPLKDTEHEVCGECELLCVEHYLEYSKHAPDSPCVEFLRSVMLA